ncbi:MAG: PQQ-binding-like beta-propeller repeat protein, partial [Mycobacteriaceae bacterium]|nr:PQQ-binding-like beta-propeller repeat protein [Mycobacteriaceae bacterium]
PPPPQQGAQQQPFAPPQQPYVPPQQAQPQWSSGGGFVDTPAAAGAGAAPFAPSSMPPPMGPPTNYDSGPGPGNMPPPAGPPTSYDSGPGSGNMPPPMGSPTSYAPGPAPDGSRSGFPSHASQMPPRRPNGRIQLGPPRAPRPVKYKRSWLLPIAVGALLVAAAAIPTALKEADKEPTTSLGAAQAKAEVMWSIREGRDGPATDEKSRLQRTGVWFTDQNVVIAESKRIAAYNQDTGALAWEYSSPDGEFVCDVDLQGDSKQAFVAFGGEKDCSVVEAIDLAAGKKIWSAKAESADNGTSDIDLGDYGDFDKYNVGQTTGIAVAGGVAVFNGQAFQVSDGKKLWDAAKALPAECTMPEFTGGAKLVALCDSTVSELDPLTGRSKWTYQAPTGDMFSSVKVASTDPVVVMRSQLTGNTAPVVAVLNDQGKEAYQITDGHPVIAPRGSLEAMSGTVPLLSTDKVLYVPGSDMSASFHTGGDTANQLSAYDRATGRKLWTKTLADGMSALGLVKTQGKLFPVRVEQSGDLLVLVEAAGGAKPLNLVRVSAADGSMTNLKEFPGTVTSAKVLMYGVVVHENNGRLFLVAYPRTPDPSLEKMKITNYLGQTVHYNMSPYRIITMQ